MVRLNFAHPASLGPESTYEGPPVDLLVTLKINAGLTRRGLERVVASPALV